MKGEKGEDFYLQIPQGVKSWEKIIWDAAAGTITNGSQIHRDWKEDEF